MALRITKQEYKSLLKENKVPNNCDNVHLPIVSFVVKGEPVAKSRPRLSRYGTYTPKKTVNYENWIKECFLLSYGNDFTLLLGELKVHITAYFSIPSSKSQKAKLMMIQGDIRPTKRPDIDNVVKCVTDALNGIVYKDDSQIVEVIARKFYSEEPRVEVTIKEIIKHEKSYSNILSGN